MKHSRFSPRVIGFITLICIIIFVLQVEWIHGATFDVQNPYRQASVWPMQLTPTTIAPRIQGSEIWSSNLQDIQNATLGFQKIYVLSMPTRRDKRDALTLSAYFSGLELEFVDGVNGSEVSTKEYPNNWDMSEPIGTIGCWRGHMDIYSKMIRDRVQTAMIMEDDVDWDVMIKAQMTDFARGTRHIQRASHSTFSPYGDGWDILSTGHCGLQNKMKEDQDYWVTDEDPTVLHYDLRTWSRTPNLTPSILSGNRTRLVLSVHRFTCLASYAITLEGAARIVYDQSVLQNAKPIDLALAQICAKSMYGFNTCLGAYPMITGVHQPAGDPMKNSDRSDHPSGPPNTVSLSRNLVFPTRLNLGTLLKGETVVKAQHPQKALAQEIDISTFELPRGRPVFIRASEYAAR
ncbi:hypothetical protein B0O99DRAFT_690711 [Bisporella sp. PMI_857]|nr:hypothetical protein B0O99DRAFT_690711 [Bisporella sp. PMI_857]